MEFVIGLTAEGWSEADILGNYSEVTDDDIISPVMVGAAADVDRRAGDEAAVVAEKEQAGGGDLVDMPLPAERDAGTLLSWLG